MPAILEDPKAPVLQRTSGAAPVTQVLNQAELSCKRVVLRDGSSATIVPIASSTQVPAALVEHLCNVMNEEIEQGDTYCMLEPMTSASFGSYWFANFAAVMIKTDVSDSTQLSNMAGVDWSEECLGTFIIKPNYSGRSSHVCNGSFLVTAAARGKGVGRVMGEAFLDYAPRLGYVYSVFNLVYETNVASLRIWDALEFERIGRVKGCGHLKSYPDRLVDAIIIGRDLGPVATATEQ